MQDAEINSPAKPIFTLAATVTTPTSTPPALNDFNSAVAAVLRLLHARMGFQTWLLMRVEGDDCVVLQAEDHGYGIRAGQVRKWNESFCALMIAGRGPSIAPRAMEIEGYRNAPVARQVTINAYVGVPIKRKDGTLFGVMLAIDPHEQPEACVEQLPMIELLAGLLGTILDQECAAAEQTRLAERERALSLRDSLTGLFNRRGWDALTSAEEARCRRYGHSACVVSIDLDHLKDTNDTVGHTAGDKLLRVAANAIQSVARDVDIIARVGGDEFLIFLVECNLAGGEALIERVHAALRLADAPASIGLATFNPIAGLSAAVDDADRAMYEQKRQHHLPAMTVGMYQ